jgi:hypothetical protein
MATQDPWPLMQAEIEKMKQAQALLWDAHSSWKKGKYLSLLSLPTALISMASYDWGDAVQKWNDGLVTWWGDVAGQSVVGLVKDKPYEKGVDGKTRLQSWLDNGEKRMNQALDIAKNMKDDTLATRLGSLAKDFRMVANKAAGAVIDTVAEPLQKASWKLALIALPLVGIIFLAVKAGISVNAGPVRIGKK